MPKATLRRNGLHMITKRVTVHIAAFHIVDAWLYEQSSNDLSRKELEKLASEQAIQEISYYRPTVDRWSKEEEKEDYLLMLDICYENCIKAFPEIPREQFKSTINGYRAVLDFE